MPRLLPVLLLLLAALLPAAPARAQDAAASGEAQALVDRATLAVQEMLGVGDSGARADGIRMLRRARAAMVCPRIFRAGFILGGEGGGCVLLARDAAGSWSSPAFYGMASGSIGFQIGVQDMQVLMLIMTERGLGAIMDSQFKIGADASIAIATIGAGIEGSTTSAAGADIVAVARARGLFAGLALEGSLLSSRSEWNRDYYGREASPRQIVLRMEAHNPGADPLRAVLMRFGAGAPAQPPMAVAPGGPSPGPTLDPQPAATYPAAALPAAGVESTPLPPIAGGRR
ncbi:lipid-binding SYLF domain-containing protein [Siccirubricoccus sp. G192]|uniref:lipid-binding SYLF domain-containing protein n=1 Tax=Siccirubricoccus sp. G192 TaxID=2849651 RepID=UPI001C2C2131|nr:lipid-binding SYLF domain-containing protein [Siccirubricoccus sp. G192]MBV1795998.1 lipid-binding SYLF domain-containing protein [Siccirubricoccus sp. G192]